ncbi:MAG: chromosomal replication initiator protein DnaA [Anaerolineae bacterium]|nr:chromosomal replication initiator protein DnaA [Anaerolineae bacterium]
MGDTVISLPADELWLAAKGELQLRMSRATYDTWLRDSTLVAYEDGTFVIGVPNAYAKDWLEHRLRGVVKQVLESIAGRSVELIFTVRPPGRHTPPIPEEDVPLLQNRVAPSWPSQHPAWDDGGVDSFNPRYTFETFVVGENNRLAHAAALAVADNPGQRYNPLFIYGGVGLGKTHLLHAIGHRSQSRGARVLYVTSEEFTNDLINAIRTQETEAFRNKYRTLDILLIDDIQFIAGKESTQEEFFHTFNTLHAANKQVVLTSDRAPKAMTTLEERLRSRFSGGLCVDIGPPDLEVRAAILKSKASMMGVHLPDDVVMLIAQSVRSNIRDLEGTLNRVIAETELRGGEITLEQTAAILQSLPSIQVAVSPEQTLELVAWSFGLSVDQLTGRKRNKEVSLARHIAMYLLRHECDLSLPQVGALLNRDHTTVMHGVERVEELVEVDDAIRRRIMSLREQMYAGAMWSGPRTVTTYVEAARLPTSRS